MNNVNLPFWRRLVPEALNVIRDGGCYTSQGYMAILECRDGSIKKVNTSYEPSWDYFSDTKVQTLSGWDLWTALIPFLV